MKNQTLNIGDIFYCEYGYNTTRIKFFQVVQVIGKCTAILSEVESITTPHNESKYWCNKVPNKYKFVGQPFRKRLSINAFKIFDYVYAFKWDGKPLSASSDYAKFID